MEPIILPLLPPTNNVTEPTNDTGGGATEQPLRVEIVISNTVERLNYTEFLLEAKVTGGTEPYTYDWGNGTRLPSLPDNMMQITVSPGATLTQDVTVTDSKNQTASDSIQLTVGEPMERIQPGVVGGIQENATTSALDTDGGTPTQPLDDTGPPSAPSAEEGGEGAGEGEETVEEEEAPVEEQPPAEEQPPPATTDEGAGEGGGGTDGSEPQ